MRTIRLLAVFLGIGMGLVAAEIEVGKVWSEGKHCAFTDLVRWNGAYWLSFRESDAHVYGQDGKTRLLRSADGEDWESVALLERPGVDLRDPKMSVGADGSLVILQGGSTYKGRTLVKRGPFVSYLRKAGEAGEEPSDPTPLALPDTVRSGNDWLWRLTWHKGEGFGVVYQPQDGDWAQVLVKTDDARRFAEVTRFALPGKPNESTVRFAPDGEMWVVVRNEGADQHGHLGRSRPPYREWTWHKIGVRLGGPDLLRLEDGTWLLATRKYAKGGAKTMVGTLSPAGQFEEKLVLPSGGDTSYPRMMVVGEELWMSYYSSHEGSTAIYLAKIPLADLRDR